MKIELIIPPAPYLIDGKVFPPLGILYAAALLEKAGHEVKVIDCLNNHKNTIERDMIECTESDCDYVGITATTPDFPSAIHLKNIIKIINPNKKVIIGGSHSKIDPKGCKKHFDMTGDELFAELGIKEDFTTVLPARHLIDMDSYHYKINGRKATNVIGQLGCPYSCAFCCQVYPLTQRNIKDVVSELDMLNKKYGYSAFMFYDDEINLNKERLFALCNELKKRDYVWRCFIRSNLFTEEMAKEMTASGCVEVLCGVESGSPKILKIINKKTTPELNSKARAICQEYQIRFKALTMIGLPSETMKDIMMTKQWLLDNKPDSFDITIFTPYPGCDIYKNKSKYDLNFEVDYEKDIAFFKGIPGEYHGLVSNSNLTAEELTSLRDEIEKEVMEAI